MAGLKDIGRRKISVTNIRFTTVSDITGSLSIGGSVFITSSVSSSFGNIHTLSGSTLRFNRIISNRVETNQITGSTLTFNTVNFHALSGSTAVIHNISASTIDVNDFQSNRVVANDIRTTSSTTQVYGQYLNSFTEHANSNQNTYFGLSLAMKDANTVYVGAYDDSVPGT